MNFKKILRFAFYSIGAAVILTQSCFAYIDPATTSLIIQIIAGVIIGCGTAVGIFWNRIKRRLKKKKGEPEEIVNAKKEGDNEEKTVITADELLAEDEDDISGDEKDDDDDKE